ncbi:MAG: GTP-binding protein [Nitrososphaerota archaeon]
MSKKVKIPPSEGQHIEFKERLIPLVHLKPERRQQLGIQLKSHLLDGGGVAVYLLGVNDDGVIMGLGEYELEMSISVLSTIAAECGARIRRVERFETEKGYIARVVVEAQPAAAKPHITLAVAGHVNHGKSTLIACLLTNQPDDGKKWLFLDTLPHEVERNLSADIHLAVLGFKNGKPVTLNNPLDKLERARVVEESEKLVSFVDTVGHEPWLRTTIRGLVGQEVDYGILVVAADDGITHLTREHLGIMLGLGMPVIVCITKTEKVSPSRVAEVREEAAQLLKKVGRIPLHIRDTSDVDVVYDKIGLVVPIIETSARTLSGFDRLYSLLSLLPRREKPLDKPFLLYIDRVYDIEGVGSVISGTVRQGRLRAGAELLLGPYPDGGFKRIKARSIEIHHARVEEAVAGYVIGVAIRGVPHNEIRRGMVVCEQELEPRAVWSFEAEVLVLNSPSRFAAGYEPVIQCHTISQSVKITELDRDYIRPGEQCQAVLEFKYSPMLVYPQDRFVLREGRTKGIGVIRKILRYA